jgi:hypothetical protein
MIKTTQGSRNGITVETFKEGKEYDLPKHLIEAFLTIKAIKVSNEEDESSKEKEESKIKTVEVPNNKIATVPNNKNTKKGK